MKTIFYYLINRLAAGLLFILPLLAGIVLLREILKFLQGLLGPLANRLPDWLPGGGYITAAAVLIVAAFLIGLFARSRLGRRIAGSLERVVLGRIPGFTLMRSLILGTIGQDGDDDVQVVLVTLDDAWLFGFLMETHPDGMLTVFVPSAPSPISGTIYFFREDQIRRTTLKVGHAMRVISRLGVRSRETFEGHLREVIEQRPGLPGQ